MKSLYIKSATLFIVFLVLTMRIVQAQATPVMHFDCDDTSYRSCYIVWHPQNNWLAIRQLYRIQLWDNTEDEYVGEFMHEGSNIFLWTSDGVAFTTIGIGNILIRDPHDGTIIQQREFGEWFAALSEDGLISPYYLGDIESMAWNPDGSQLAFVSGYYLLRWDIDSNMFDLIYASDHSVVVVDWSPNGSTIALATDRHLVLIDAVTFEVQLAVDYPSNLASQLYNGSDGLKWSPDGQWVAVAAHARLFTQDIRPAHVFLLNPENGKFEKFIATESQLVLSLAWSPNGRWLAVAASSSPPRNSNDTVVFTENAVRIWDIETNSIAKYLPFDSPVFMVTWSADGDYVATSTNDGSIDIWENDLD